MGAARYGLFGVPLLLILVPVIVLAWKIGAAVGTVDTGGVAAEELAREEKNSNKCRLLLGGGAASSGRSTGGAASYDSGISEGLKDAIVVGALGIKGEDALFRQWNATFSTCGPLHCCCFAFFIISMKQPCYCAPLP
jgi:hypothetical protein